MNEKETETLVVENNSDSSPLVLYSVDLQEFDGSDGDDYDDKRELSEVGDSWDEGEITIEPGESKTFDVEYQPRNTTVDEGVVVLETNVSNDEGGVVEVPVETSELAPELTPQPSDVNFDRVPPGEVTDSFVTIRNDGQAPLQISDVWGSGSSEFEIGFPEVEGDTDEAEIPPREEDSDEWPEVLEPGEDFLVRVTFSPEDDLPKEGKLNLESNDPESGTTRVDLSGNSGAACMAVPDAVDFDSGSLDQTNSKNISIENCSRTEELEISNIEVTDDGEGTFSIQEDSLPEGLSDGDEAVVETGERATFTIDFKPDEEEEFEGELLIESNDSANEEATIDLVGVGSDNQCPTADFDASVEGGRAYGPDGHIEALPLDTVEFDGTESEDEDGSIERYEWTILDRPSDSTQRMQPNDEAESELFLDVAGTYEIELNVYDDENARNCDDAIIEIEAKPEDDIHIQLVWDTPSDPDQTDDFGTDLDLHYLHPDGRWNESPYDIYWRNMEADWGQEGDSSDDPSLDIDDTNGAGPENVNHSDPENLTYRTGVYYYEANGFGESYATMRIFIEGELVRELENKPMAETGVFWDVATIEWPTGDVTVVDRISDGFP
ncbi:MAG: choice-of-anchor D domain-containing protein [Persicimonas sp.]